MAKAAMEHIGLEWNPKKCNILHVKRGIKTHTSEGFQIGDINIGSLKEDAYYRFLGTPEQLLQEEKLALESAAGSYLKRLSVIWSSPLSDRNRVAASNQLALPVLSYLMWSLHWNLSDLRPIDREARKIICENGGKHPHGSTALIYLPRVLGGRGLRQVEMEYKQTKIKAALKLYSNNDATMDLVRSFEEQSSSRGHQSLIKEASKFAEELELSLDLSYPNPKCSKKDGEDIPKAKVKLALRQAANTSLQQKIQGERWQGKYLTARWADEDLNLQGCFAWMRDWKEAPTHNISGIVEMYEQQVPTKLYTARKTQTSPTDDILSRLCGKEPESLPHILSGCSAFAQDKYLERHNAALQILFFEKLRDF